MITPYKLRLTFEDLIPAANGINDGLVKYQENLGVDPSTLNKINAALAALCGTEGQAGSEALCNQAMADPNVKSTLFDQATRRAEEVARSSMNVLRNVLGNHINPAWQAAGFSRSLKIGRLSYSVLLKVRMYLQEHPEAAVASQGVTAAELGDVIQSLDVARRAKKDAQDVLEVAKLSRDQDRKTLYKRIVVLHAELRAILPPDDMRWYGFGFARPVDGRIPTPVADLNGAQLAPGTIELTWTASVRAKQYRVQWYAKAAPDAVTSIGFTGECAITLHDLPMGTPVAFQVSACNKSGETQPAELEFTRN